MSVGPPISGFHDGALAPDHVSEITCSSARHCVAYEGVFGLLLSGSVAHPRSSVVETSDGGRTWRRETFTGIVGPVVCGDDAHCVAGYLTSFSGPTAIVSHDGGLTWERTSMVLRGLDSLACPSASHCIAVGDDSYVTTDGGARWTLSLTPKVFEASDAVDLACPATTWCMAGTSGGPSNPFEVSSNGGITWSAVPTLTSGGPNSLSCPAVRTCSAAGPGLIHTTDGGKIWTAAPQPGPSSDWLVHCVSRETCLVFTTPSASDVLEHGFDHAPLEVKVTHDGGATWRVVALGAGLPPDDNSVACPTTTTCFMVKATGSILVTHDGGDVWTRVS
jgi:photosystem II stability/assembly factor-like uncharacterized protein